MNDADRLPPINIDATIENADWIKNIPKRPLTEDEKAFLKDFEERRVRKHAEAKARRAKARRPVFVRPPKDITEARALVDNILGPPPKRARSAELPVQDKPWTEEDELMWLYGDGG